MSHIRFRLTAHIHIHIPLTILIDCPRLYSYIPHRHFRGKFKFTESFSLIKQNQKSSTGILAFLASQVIPANYNLPYSRHSTSLLNELSSFNQRGSNPDHFVHTSLKIVTALLFKAVK